MAEYRFTTPLTEEDVRKLRIGDTVILDGIIYGIRDANLIRLFDKGEKLPEGIDFNGAACIHTAPNVRKVGDKYEKVCIGTTTSTRMDRFTPGLMKQYGVRAIIGKAGQYDAALEAMKEHGGVYLAIVGGAAALETTQIEEIEDYWWEDLLPEAIWKFRVKGFGPLIVGMDSHGGHLYYQVKDQAKAKLPEIYKKMGIE